ncbi:MAG: hypothetical protein AAF250_13355 [Pseudomonadota bacterium]
MLVERRRSGLPIDLFARVGIAWTVVSALLIVVNWGAITQTRFPDPDDIMRLVQVHDLIGGQSWFDLTQYRVDAANGGVAMHWSRLVDVPLLLVIAILTPLFGAATAETAAMVIIPLLTLGLAMLLAARIAWRLMGDEEATLTSFIVAVSIPVLFQLAPMRIDHHGWQIVCALAAVNALMSRQPRSGGWLLGASCAVWLTISIEGLPLVAAIFGVLTLRWLRDRNARDWLVRTIQSLTLVGGALFLGTRGIGDLSAHCDTISPVHLGMFAWGAVVLTVLGRFEPMPSALRLGGFGLAAGGALGAMLYAAPQCAAGPFPAMDPLVGDYWVANVSEGLPIWRQSLGTALQYAVTPVIGILAALNLTQSSRDWLRRYWGDYTLILIAAFAVSIFVARAGAIACVLAAPAIAWQVREWLRRIRLMKRPAPRLAAMLAVICALLPAFPMMVLASAIPAKASLSNAVIAAPSPKASTCRVDLAAPDLAALPDGEIYAPIDIGAHLLLETDHTVIATGHHRGQQGMHVVIETALGPAKEARATLSGRGTAYVALCPMLNETRLYAQSAPQGFAAQLVGGDAPDWLESIKTDGASGLKVWKIKPE